MSKNKETKKVSIFAAPECFAFMIGEIPCLVYFEPLEDKVTFTATGDELPKISDCLRFLREHFTHLDLIKKIYLETINW